MNNFTRFYLYNVGDTRFLDFSFVDKSDQNNFFELKNSSFYIEIFLSFLKKKTTEEFRIKKCCIKKIRVEKSSNPFMIRFMFRISFTKDNLFCCRMYCLFTHVI